MQSPPNIPDWPHFISRWLAKATAEQSTLEHPDPCLLQQQGAPCIEHPENPLPDPCPSPSGKYPLQLQLSCQGTLCTVRPKTTPTHTHFSSGHPTWAAPACNTQRPSTLSRHYSSQQTSLGTHSLHRRQPYTRPFLQVSER